MKIEEKFRDVREKLKDPKFLNGRGTGNDLSFYVFDYDPKEEIKVEYYTNIIINDFNTSEREYIKEYDLYKMFIQFLKEQDIFEQIMDMEKTDDKDYIFTAITAFINQDMYVNTIKEEFEKYRVIFITGVGKIYPFMRSHNILNRLHSVLGKKPLVLFYPGEYTGQDLTLFNKFMDDNYYRAFPITD